MYVLNKCPTRALSYITFYEAWDGKKESIGHLHVFNCFAYTLMPNQHCKKLDENFVKWIFVGYSTERKGYRSYHP